MSFRGGKFSTGTTGNFQPELTDRRVSLKKAGKRTPPSNSKGKAEKLPREESPKLLRLRRLYERFCLTRCQATLKKGLWGASIIA